MLGNRRFTVFLCIHFPTCGASQACALYTWFGTCIDHLQYLSILVGTAGLVAGVVIGVIVVLVLVVIVVVVVVVVLRRRKSGSPQPPKEEVCWSALVIISVYECTYILCCKFACANILGYLCFIGLFLYRYLVKPSPIRYVCMYLVEGCSNSCSYSFYIALYLFRQSSTLTSTSLRILPYDLQPLRLQYCTVMLLWGRAQPRSER